MLSHILLSLLACRSYVDIDCIDSASCSDEALETNGAALFSPQEGRAADAPDGSPGQRRLLIAGSHDGLHFDRHDEVLLNQANAPSMIRHQDTLFVYTTAYLVDGKSDGTVVSVLEDGAEAWSHYVVVFEDLPENLSPRVEACAVVLPDGRIRLYFGAQEAGVWTIRSAVSDGGLVFRYEGEVVVPNGGVGHNGGYVDPLIAWVGEEWHLFLQDTSTNQTVHGRSPDGLYFELETLDALSSEVHLVLANWLEVEDGHRIFASAPNTIESFWTEDGEVLWREEGSRLEPESGVLEVGPVSDPAVIHDGEQGYLMFYVSEIPE
ncbi:MAG: hypothetical protein ACI8RZ_003025 [Myxococcota bacterium]|jgi:hypothetical protein